MGLSVESFCNLLARGGLLAAEEVRTLHQRWRLDAGTKAQDVEAFHRWVVENQYLTQYQAWMLANDHADRLFLNQYKLVDRIGQGRMAGVYKAVHQVGQVVAIKVLPPSKAREPSLFARFQRE